MTPDQALAAAKKAVRRAKTVHVVGTAAAGGKPLTLDLKLVAGKGGTGHVASGDLAYDIVRIGDTAYVRGGDAFWSRLLSPAQVPQLYADKWISAPAGTGLLAALTPVTNLSE